jgi:ankyrin repeat protein
MKSNNNQADINSQIMNAILKDNVTLLERLLELPNGIDNLITTEWTPLLYAISQNKINAVKYLLDNRANVNFSSQYDENALKICTMVDNTQMLDLLLNYQLNPPISANSANSIGLYLTSANTPQTLNLFLTRYPDSPAKQYIIKESLIYIFGKEFGNGLPTKLQKEMAKAILKYPGVSQILEEKLEHLTNIISMSGNITMADLLINCFADPDKQNHTAILIIQQSAVNASTPLIKHLLESGHKINEETIIIATGSAKRFLKKFQESSTQIISILDSVQNSDQPTGQIPDQIPGQVSNTAIAPIDEILNEGIIISV